MNRLNNHQMNQISTTMNQWAAVQEIEDKYAVTNQMKKVNQNSYHLIKLQETEAEITKVH